MIQWPEELLGNEKILITGDGFGGAGAGRGDFLCKHVARWGHGLGFLVGRWPPSPVLDQAPEPQRD